MRKLVIDTSSNKEIIVGLDINGKRDMVRHAIDNRKAQVVLPLVEEMLRTHNISFKDITAIEVETGPGSFTGLRVGVSIANTLGLLLQVPINGKKIGETAAPMYTE